MDFWAHAAAQARHPTHKIFALKSCLRKWINHSSRINTVLLKHRQKHVAEHMQLWGYLEQAQLLANTQCCQRHKLSGTCQPIENCFLGIIRFQEVTRRIENPKKKHPQLYHRLECHEELHQNPIHHRDHLERSLPSTNQ